jgi:hypothetical protein
MIALPILIMTISLFLVFIAPLLLKVLSDALAELNERRDAIDALSGLSDKNRPNE